MRIVQRTESLLVLADGPSTRRSLVALGLVIAIGGLPGPWLFGIPAPWAWVLGAVLSALGAALVLFVERRTCVIDRESGRAEIRRTRTIGTVVVSVPLSEITGAKFVEYTSDDTTWLDVILVRGDKGETSLGRFEGSDEEIRAALAALGLKASD